MYNILRHHLCIFADAIRTAGAEAKNCVNGVLVDLCQTQSAQRALRQRGGAAVEYVGKVDAIRTAGAEAKLQYVV